MANLKYKTRGNSSPNGKPRVYFCCHPEDFERYFEVVSDEILAKQNCAIWYTDEIVTRNEDFLAGLKQMQLFVMPVTANLLHTKNEALNIDFRFAIENHIPVLPLMQENGLEELFNKKCGDLQFLDKNNNDTTSISYDEKLQKYLESVLIGDELAEKVRAAFDAYVFLSYRKKDRKYAQELMRLIHKNAFCRDIAIWYDEFLIPGENFNDSIKEALKKSGLFVLAVTPNLVNEPNYIMTTEYPMAKQDGKPLLPAELVPTDRKQLSEKYEDLPDPIDAHNEAELSNALLESIKKMAIKENDNSPEHNYFIGLAYLGGVDVEVDYDRALSLITYAAEAQLVEAMKKLIDIYQNGIGVKRDYYKACEWKVKINQILFDELLADFNEIDNRNRAIEKYSEVHRNKPSREILEIICEHMKALEFFKAFVGEKIKRWCECQLELCDMYRQADETALAENTLIETIEFLSNNQQFDVTNIWDCGLISEPNSPLINTTFFDLHMKLIELFTTEMKYDLVKKWYQKVLMWIQKVMDRLCDINYDVWLFKREVELKLAHTLYQQGKYDEVQDLLTHLVEEVMDTIHKVTSIDTSKISFSVADGILSVTGISDFMEFPLRKASWLNFLSDVFMLLGKTYIKLDLIEKALEAFDKAVAFDKNSEQKAKLRREIIGKLREAELFARLKDYVKAQEYLNAVDERLKYITENNIEIVFLKREYFRKCGEVALLNNEDSALGYFEKAIEISKSLAQEVPSVENIFYLVELYEKMCFATKNNTLVLGYIDSMCKLTTANLLKGDSPKAKEALGNTYFAIYNCNNDLEFLEKAYTIFCELVASCPETIRFSLRLDEIKKQKG